MANRGTYNNLADGGAVIDTISNTNTIANCGSNLDTHRKPDGTANPTTHCDPNCNAKPAPHRITFHHAICSPDCNANGETQRSALSIAYCSTDQWSDCAPHGTADNEPHAISHRDFISDYNCHHNSYHDRE